MSDTYAVTSEEDLREILGTPHELVTKKIIASMDDMARRFVTNSPFVMLSTANADGVPDVSPRGDERGFTRIIDDTTLLLPERPGNKLAFSLKNILENPNVSLMYIIPGVDEAYRFHGTARLTKDPAILEGMMVRGNPALMAIEVKITRCFLHCGKAMKRSQLWKVDPKASKMEFRFGATIARETGGGAEVEELVNKIVAEDYKDNL